MRPHSIATSGIRALVLAVVFPVLVGTIASAAVSDDPEPIGGTAFAIGNTEEPRGRGIDDAPDPFRGGIGDDPDPIHGIISDGPDPISGIINDNPDPFGHSIDDYPDEDPGPIDGDFIWLPGPVEMVDDRDPFFLGIGDGPDPIDPFLLCVLGAELNCTWVVLPD